MRRLIALTIVAVLVPSAVASAKNLVRYAREGGFRGVPLSLTIGEAGKARAVEGVGGPTARFTLSEQELKGVKRLLRRADFENLESNYLPKPGTIADGFTETVTYRGKTVTTGTGGDAPRRLDRLCGRLATLAESAQ